MGNIRKSKKQPKVKEPVRLRYKELANGCNSIYLDIYTSGQRHYEFLKLYLTPESTPLDKEQNRQTLEIAKTIQSQRIVDLQKAEHGLSNTSNKKQKMLLVDYIKHVSESKSPQTKRSYDTLILFVQDFAPNTTMKQADKDFCLNFIHHLKNAKSKRAKEAKPLTTNTQIAYLKKLKVVFRSAVENGIINKNPFDSISKEQRPKRTATEIPFLTFDEVQRLNATPCSTDIKAAYLFACYTGLRFSDISRLTWGNIKKVNNETMLVYKQKKTGKQEYLNLANPALSILKEKTRQTDTDKIFQLWTNENTNRHLRRFATDAGLDGDKVTFHTARHTAATMLLSLGVPIEVVSKILGHADIRTTQIYAKVLAEQVKTGIHKLDNIFDNNKISTI
jgi:integrase